MKRGLAFAVGLVLVVWAVLASITHPTLQGYVCADFPGCQFSALAYPERMRSLVDVFHFATSLSAAIAGAVFLVHTASRRKKREAARLEGVPAPASFAPSLLFLLTLTAGHLALSGEWGLAPRATHFFAMLLAHGAVLFFFAFAWPWEGGLLRWVKQPWRGVAVSLGALVLFVGMATALFQFESGFFSCGDDKTFCAEALMLSQSSSVVGAVVWVRSFLMGAAGVAALSVFFWGVLRIVRWKHRGGALLLPWLSVAWLASFLFRDIAWGVDGVFAVNQFTGWALALVLFFVSHDNTVA